MNDAKQSEGRHSEEPWYVEGDGLTIFQNGRGELSMSERKANAARIVACLNGCKEVPSLWFQISSSSTPVKDLIDENQLLRAQLDEAKKENERLRGELKDAKDGEAYSDKLLCDLWDKLGSRGKPEEHESAIERIRDLIIAEDQLQSAQEKLNSIVEGIKTHNLATIIDGDDITDHGWTTIKAKNLAVAEAQEKLRAMEEEHDLEFFRKYGALIDRWLGTIPTDKWTSQAWYEFNDARVELRTLTLQALTETKQQPVQMKPDRPKVIKLPPDGWKPQTYYWVRVQMSEFNTPHLAIFYSGFLNGENNTPGAYAGKLAGADQHFTDYRELYSIEFVAEISKPNEA